MRQSSVLTSSENNWFDIVCKRELRRLSFSVAQLLCYSSSFSLLFVNTGENVQPAVRETREGPSGSGVTWATGAARASSDRLRHSGLLSRICQSHQVSARASQKLWSCNDWFKQVIVFTDCCFAFTFMGSWRLWTTRSWTDMTLRLLC